MKRGGKKGQKQIHSDNALINMSDVPVKTIICTSCMVYYHCHYYFFFIIIIDILGESQPNPRNATRK